MMIFRLLAAALLLVPVSANAAQTLFPYEPTPDWATFTLQAPAQVMICKKADNTCSTPRLLPTGSYNCWGTFPVPAGTKQDTYECRPSADAPPVTLPTGVAQIALYGELFAHPNGLVVGQFEFDA